jgi:hypothetical protein
VEVADDHPATSAKRRVCEVQQLDHESIWEIVDQSDRVDEVLIDERDSASPRGSWSGAPASWWDRYPEPDISIWDKPDTFTWGLHERIV